MDNDAFDTLLAALDEPAADDIEAPASADVDEAPLLDSVPSDPQDASPDGDVSDQSADATEPDPEPAKPDWDSPDNPYLLQMQQLLQQQQAWQQQQQAWEAQQQQQQVLMQQQQQQVRYQELDAKWREIAGGDLEAYDAIRASVAEVTQPYVQQAQAFYADAEQAKRIATATHIAATYGLTPEQQETLNANIRHFLSMQSPEQMLADVEYRKAIHQQQTNELQRLQQENAELRKFQEAQQQARQRMTRGADAVEVVGVGRAAASPADESFDDLFNRVIGAA